MTAKTNAERQAAFRLTRKDRPEVRGIFALPEDHQTIKDFAAKLAKNRAKLIKVEGSAPHG